MPQVNEFSWFLAFFNFFPFFILLFVIIHYYKLLSTMKLLLMKTYNFNLFF